MFLGQLTPPGPDPIQQALLSHLLDWVSFTGLHGRGRFSTTRERWEDFLEEVALNLSIEDQAEFRRVTQVLVPLG